MKLIWTIVCSIVALATGDVAHLGRNYLPPARTVAFNSAQGYANENNFAGERLTQLQVVPSLNYALPAAPVASYTSSSSFNTGYRAPPRFSTPSASTAFSTQRFNSARLAAPSRQYLTPEVETFEPIVQKTYSAPAITYSAPAATSSAFTASSNSETRYAADGGYVY